MLDVALAIMTGFVWAVGIVLTRKNLPSSDFFSSAVTVVFVGNIVLLPLLFVLRQGIPLSVQGLLFFLLAGFLHSGIARLLYNIGMLKIGVAAYSSIFSTNSLFGTVLAVLLLNEQPTVLILLGIICVVIGTIVIQGSMRNRSKTKSMKHDMLIPVSASVIVGLSYVARKIGLNLYNEPLAGVAAGYAATLASCALIFAFSSKIRRVTRISSQTFRLFWKAGVCDVTGWILMFYAFQYGNIAVVTSLLQSQPLFVLLLTFLFLKKEETLSRKLMLGAVTIVVGVVLVTVFKN